MILRSALATFALLMSFSSSATCQGQQDYKKALVKYFEKNSGWQPFVLFEGQQVGDIIDTDTRAVLKARDDCFGNLKVSDPIAQKDDSEMLDFGASAASVFLSIQKFLSLTANESAIQSVHVLMTEVKIVSTSINEFIKAKKADCPELTNPLQLNNALTLFNRDATLINSIMSAKLDVIVVASSKGDAAANVESIKFALKGLSWTELDASMAAKLQVSASRSFRVKGTEARSIAFRPAYIRRSWLSGTGQPDPSVEPFDENNVVHQDALLKESRNWARSDVGVPSAR
jgi:hypothetical protein